MPIRDYSCAACGHRFEKLERVSSPVRTRCPVCRSADLKRAFSGFAVAAATSVPSPAAPAPCGACGSPQGPGTCAPES